MTQASITSALGNKVNTSSVVQTTGESTTLIMSQSAVSSNLESKVDKEDGKELSTNDYTTAEKNKLSGIESEANKTVISQLTGTSTTSVMSQKAVTDAINLASSDIKGVQKNSVDLVPDSSGKVNVTVPILIGNIGQSNTDGMTQNAITTELNGKINTSSIVQSTGISTSNIMSQKAVTDAINSAGSDIKVVQKNGADLTPDSSGKVNVIVPTLLSSTGSSTSEGMTQSAITTALNSKADSSGLSEVATSGSYDDLSNKPTIPTLLSTTGQSTTAGMTQKAITDALGNKADSSSLSDVATSGSYNDLSNKPSIPTLLSSTGSSTTEGMTQASITNELNSKVDISSIVQVTGSSTTNIMSQSAVSSAISDAGSEVKVVQRNGTDLTPDSSGKVNVIVPILESSTGSSTTAGMTQSAITTALSSKADSSSLSTVATSGLYSDLTGTPNLSTVATSGDYDDLSNKPSIPTLLSTTGQSTTDGMTQSAITTALNGKTDSSSLSTVATSGDYDDLLNKPTIPEMLQSTGTSTTNGMTQSAITNALNGKAVVTTFDTTLSTSWTGSSAPYTQTVSVSGVLSTDNPIVDVVLSSTTSTAISQLAGWGCVSKITTSNGSITATCFEEKPTVSIPIQMCVVR